MEKLITLPMVIVLVMTIGAAVGGFFTTYEANREKRNERNELRAQNEDLKRQNELLTKEVQGLKGPIIDLRTGQTLRPGNEPDPPIKTQAKVPPDAIKLYLGSCLAWWSPNVLDAYSVVIINNEPVLILGLEEKGLFISGPIRREDGREVVTLDKNTYKENKNTNIRPQRPSERELIVCGESGERLLYVNYLNEKAIAIEGTFYDSVGNRILTIGESGIVDMYDNHFMPGASLGGNKNLFAYQTLRERYQLTVCVATPAPIGVGTSDDELEFMYKGTAIKNLSRATVLVGNTGREPIRLGINGKMELAIEGQFLDLEKPPLTEPSDNIIWDPAIRRLMLDRLLIRPNETKAIHLLMQGEWKCDIYPTLQNGNVIKFNMDEEHFVIH